MRLRSRPLDFEFLGCSTCCLYEVLYQRIALFILDGMPVSAEQEPIVLLYTITVREEETVLSVHTDRGASSVFRKPGIVFIK